MADKNAFLIRLLATVIILAVFIFLFVRDLDAENKKKIKETPQFDLSMCPANGWVNCMPIVEESRQFMCEKEFMDWAKSNCPNFQGGAL